MAAPVFQSIGNGNTNTATLVITAPTGIQDGDLLLFFGWHETGNAGADYTTVPTGFTIVGARVENSETSHWCYKKIASGESGNYTFVHGTANGQGGFILRISGADPTTPVDVLQQLALAATNLNLALSGSTQVADSLLVAVGASDDTVNTTYTINSGTERDDRQFTATFLCGAAYTDAAATVTSYSRTLTKTGTARRQAGALVAVRPVVAAGEFTARLPRRGPNFRR
jgi:hypothetical protein